MNPQHATYFLNTNDEFEWSQIHIRNTVINLNQLHNLNINEDNFPDQGLTKGELLVYCSSNQYSLRDKCLMIMIWGGMIGQRLHHSANFYQHFNDRTKFVLKSLINASTRKEAFTFLRIAKEGNLLPGVRVPFYTKFLFFLNPQLNGYILDRWTGKSYDLLMEGENVPPLTFDHAGFLEDATPDQYEHFCSTIDELTIAYNLHNRTQLSGYDIEGKLFTSGGNWRAYLLNQNAPIQNNNEVGDQGNPNVPPQNGGGNRDNPPPQNEAEEVGFQDFPELIRFNTNLININNNMDRIFWCYLAYLNNTKTWIDNAHRPLENIINEVPNLQFIGHNNLIQATYNFTKYAMINSAAGRNYFQFEAGPQLQQQYTVAINDPNREYGVILQLYGNCRIRINPAYINN